MYWFMGWINDDDDDDDDDDVIVNPVVNDANSAMFLAVNYPRLCLISSLYWLLGCRGPIVKVTV
jgi:hypothetical protein